jgi:N-acetylglucosamine-6-phosphate deacetylase
MILAGALVRGGSSLAGWLRVEDDVIAEIGEGSPPPGAAVERAHWVTPGLVDLQVNGAGGREVVGGADALAEIDSVMLASGVTGYLPTVITTDDATAAAAVADVAARMAAGASPALGVHLEGPFLSPDRPGVHRTALLRTPAQGIPAHYDDPACRLVTLAPELPGAIELVERLVRRGTLVSLGHTAASPEVAEHAVRAGAGKVTHLFNAMPPFHHRDPGIAGWALARGAVAIGIVPDGFHVAPDALRTVREARSERVVLVTDASAAAGAEPGVYEQAGLTIERHPDGRVTTLEGDLAGSGITLDEGVRRWVHATTASFPEAVEAASTRPASLIRERRELEPAAPADVVLWNEALEVERVLFRGAWLK